MRVRNQPLETLVSMQSSLMTGSSPEARYYDDVAGIRVVCCFLLLLLKVSCFTLVSGHSNTCQPRLYAQHCNCFLDTSVSWQDYPLPDAYLRP